jgi:hypothetical protein
MTSTMDQQRDQTTHLLVALIDNVLRFGLSGFDPTRLASATLSTPMFAPARSMLERARHECCEMPEPCWMPEQVGTVTSYVCAGGTATLRIRVTNHSTATRTLSVNPSGPSSTSVSITPSTASVGPFESSMFAVSLTLPADGCAAVETLIWIRGCRDHIVRWNVIPSSRAVDCCHELDVTDAPDLVHHWYDHFACPRPCGHSDG